MRNTIHTGKDGSVDFIPPHALLNDLHLSLSSLVYDYRSTPQQLVDAMACIASIVKTLGPPITIIKNPTEMP